MNAGVWIDHRKAVIVLVTDKGEDLRQITSGVDKPRRSIGSPRSKHSYTPNDFVAEDKLQRKFAIDLNTYYDQVIACIRDADAILILGPGEAKLEFKKRIESRKLRGQIAEVESADKLTDRQVAAIVRAHFAGQLSR
jgi:stalled ribosome rescue protein Dom34